MVDAEKVVRNLIIEILEEKKSKHKDIKINSLSSDGANYTSALYTITVSTDEEDLELFAKVAIIGEETRGQMNADLFYKTEIFVYEKLVEVYAALQDEHNVPEEHRFVFPKCYKAASEMGKETLVMENLLAKGYKPFNRFDCMDWEYAALSVDLLAKFHALSFAYAKKYPTEFEEVTNKMIYMFSNDNKVDEIFRELWLKMVDGALEVVDEEQRGKVKPLLLEADIIRRYNKPIGKPILAHGDYRLSNIVFREQDNALEGMVLDYQMVHIGCIPTDLLYLIFLGSDEEFRRQHYERLLDHYYESLCQAMRRLNVDPVEAYPRETFDKEMKQTLPYVFYLAVAILPVVTVDPDSAPTLAGQADNFESFLKVPNALFASRFRGIVNDCARLGVF